MKENKHSKNCWYILCQKKPMYSLQIFLAMTYLAGLIVNNKINDKILIIWSGLALIMLIIITVINIFLEYKQ